MCSYNMHGSHVVWVINSICNKDLVATWFLSCCWYDHFWSSNSRTFDSVLHKTSYNLLKTVVFSLSIINMIHSLTEMRQSLVAQVICHWVSYLDVSFNCISAPHSQLNLPASYPSFTLGRKAPTSPSEGSSKGMAMFLNRKERLSDDGPADDSELESGDRCSTPYSDLLGIMPCL